MTDETYLKFPEKVFWLLFLLAVFLSGFAQGQTNVAPAPPLHFQFLSSIGQPLAGGFLYTYTAGTSAFAPTYADAAGQFPNPNPIPLDATGAPSNGSVQVGIFLANQAYKFVAFNSLGVQQWSQDGVASSLGVLNLANVWTTAQTFGTAVTITPVDNQLITGALGNQTTLDFPPPTGNVTLHFPNTSDTMVGRATIDTLSNKSFAGTISLLGNVVQSGGGTTELNYTQIDDTLTVDGGTWLLAPLKLGSTLIQQATNTIGGVCTFAASTTCTKTFNSAYTSTPLVFLQAVNPSAITVTLTSVSTTGFTITASGSTSISVDWLAIGNPN